MAASLPWSPGALAVGTPVSGEGWGGEVQTEEESLSQSLVSVTSSVCEAVSPVFPLGLAWKAMDFSPLGLN